MQNTIVTKKNIHSKTHVLSTQITRHCEILNMMISVAAVACFPIKNVFKLIFLINRFIAFEQIQRVQRKKPSWHSSILSPEQSDFVSYENYVQKSFSWIKE